MFRPLLTTIRVLIVTDYSNSTICAFVQDVIIYSCLIQIQNTVLYVRNQKLKSFAEKSKKFETFQQNFLTFPNFETFQQNFLTFQNSETFQQNSFNFSKFPHYHTAGLKTHLMSKSCTHKINCLSFYFPKNTCLNIVLLRICQLLFHVSPVVNKTYEKSIHM